MKSYHILTCALIASFAVALPSCSHKKTEDTTAVMPVEVAEAQTDSVLLYKTYPGTLGALHKVDLVARVNGYLRSINYTGGDLVKQGQVLFTIEDTQYRNAVEQARAALATAKSSNTYSANQYAAMKKALESDAVSQMEVIQAKSNLEESEASIKNAEAALQTALANLSYCTVRAPFTGQVSNSGPNVGAYLSGEGSPVVLATIYDNSALNANFSIEDASFLRMFTNENNRHLIDYSKIPVRFSESLPHTYTADLSYMAPDVNSSTGTLELQARIENPYQELRDGMYVTVSLPFKVEPKAILIKDTAISTDQLGKYIYVVNDSDKVVYTPIKIGDMANDSMRVVNEGIEPGARYVTKAMLKVRNGITVKPVLTK